jgi:hypothetical protein
MQLITGEFLILAVLIYISQYVRSRYAVVESILRGSIVFFPPDIQAKEKNMTFVSIDDKFSLKSPFFPEFEVLAVIFYMTLSLTSISALLQFNPWVTIGSSVSFYMILTSLMVCLYGLYKQSYSAGAMNPENILSFLYSSILFFAFAIILNYDHSNYLDFNFKISVQLLELQLAKSLKGCMPKGFSFTVDYFVLSCFLALISVLCLFPTFRYISRFVSGYQDNPSQMHKKLHAGLIIAPMLLMTLWIKPMTKDFLVPYLGEYFIICRIALVLVFCGIRLYNIRIEVQSLLNQTSKIVQDVLLHPKKENLDLCTRKCRAIGTMTWPYAHQSLCCTGILVLCLLGLICRGNILSPYPEKTTETITFKNPDIGYNTDEFLVRSSESEYLTKTLITIKEIQRLKDEISLIPSSENIDFTEVIVSVSRKHLVHSVFFRDLFEFLLWSTCFGWSLATIMSFLILNVGHQKAKTS